MIIKLADLRQLREIHSTEKIVLATGTFDLFHWEHLRYLQDAKKEGNILVVAIKDNKCAALKGKNRPIIDEQQRIEIVDAFKMVIIPCWCQLIRFLQRKWNTRMNNNGYGLVCLVMCLIY